MKANLALEISSTKRAFEQAATSFANAELRRLGEFEVLGVSDALADRQIQALARIFAQISAPFTRVVDEKAWIERPELKHLEIEIQSRDSFNCVILGPAGSGKTWLLARLARDYAKQGFPVLALRAGQLATSIRSINELLAGTEGSGSDLINSLIKLSKHRKVLVVIDGLDELADLSDLKSDRLNVVLNFVYALVGKKNMHVILSSRQFEFRHDVRLATLQLESVVLGPLQREVAERMLAARGLKLADLPAKLGDLLTSPLYLRIVLDLIEDGASIVDLASYQGLLERFWARNLYGPSAPEGASDLVEKLAIRMAEDEVLMVPTNSVGAQRSLVDRLVSAGILALSADGAFVSFAHKTLFEYALAKAQTSAKESLADFVLRRQTALFIRPKLWISLPFIRSANPALYERELKAIWFHPNLRKHVQYLLIDFLGTVKEPFEWEAALVVQLIKEVGPHQNHLLRAFAGNPAWYEILHASFLPWLMAEAVRAASPARHSNLGYFLARAWEFAHDRNIDLIRKYWLGEENGKEMALRALFSVQVWHEKAVEIAEQIAASTDHLGWGILNVASGASETKANFGARIARKHVEHVIRRQLDNAVDSGELVKFDQIFSGSMDWYELKELAGRIPEDFLRELWPSLVTVSRAISDSEAMPHDLRLSNALLLDHLDRETDNYFLAAFSAAATDLAKEDPLRYAAFANSAEGADLSVPMAILAIGFAANPEKLGEEAARFLIRDSRRFAIGDVLDRTRHTRALLRAIGPYLAEETFRTLENTILSFASRKGSKEEKGKAAKYALYLRRRQVHGLLTVLPAERLSPAGAKVLREERRVFGTDVETFKVRSGFVGSPMSKEQMSKADDEQIISLFEDLTDATGWSHPKRFMAGGSIQAAREFAEFAKTAPSRAVQILRKLKPGRMERPAGYALEALANVVDDGLYFSVIQELDSAGFTTAEFRIPVARGLGSIGGKRGLPSEVLDLLERWLSESQLDDSPQDQVGNDGERYLGESILWGRGGLRVLPQGAFNIIEASILGILVQNPKDPERAVRLLEAHLARGDSSRVWTALLRYVPHLKGVGRRRFSQFVARLFSVVPESFYSLEGFLLLAAIHWSLPRGQLRHYLSLLREAESKSARQAYGELLFIRYVLQGQEQWVRELLANALEGNSVVPGAGDQSNSIRVGIAHSAAHLWNQSEARSSATATLLVLLKDPQTAPVVLEMFRVNDTIFPDFYTRQILESIGESPELLRGKDLKFLIDGLEKVLPVFPALVARIATQIVQENANQLRSHASALSLSASALVNISLTLQRYGEPYRSDGLGLFEKLLDLQMDDAESALVDIDEVRPAAPRQSARVRRMRRK